MKDYFIRCLQIKLIIFSNRDRYGTGTTMATTIAKWFVLPLMLSLASCEVLNQESSTSTIVNAAQQCADAVLQRSDLNLYGNVAAGNATYSSQLAGQMCMAAALRHELNTDNDVSHGIFDKATPSDLYSFVKSMRNSILGGSASVTVDTKSLNYEIKDLALQSSRIAVYESTIRGPQQGSLSAVVYHFDTLCSNSDIGVCSQDQQIYCDVNHVIDNVSFARYTEGTLQGGCWSQYQKVPTYSSNMTNNFVQSGFPLLGTFQSTDSPAQLLLAKQLAHNAVHANANATFTLDNTTSESIMLKYGDYTGSAGLTGRLRAKIKSQHEQCPLNLVAYTESIQNMTNGPFPFVVEDDNDGICILARNENLLAGSVSNGINKVSSTAIGSTALTGYCGKNSTLFVRGPPRWDYTIPIRPLFSVISNSTIFVIPQVCPALMKSSAAIANNYILVAGDGDGICQQTYCSELMFNPGTGFISTIYADSSDSTLPSASSITWPRGQNEDPGKGSIDGVLCNPSTSNLKLIKDSLNDCGREGYNVGLNSGAAYCAIFGAAFSAAQELVSNITSSPYAYGTRGFAVDTYTPSNQTGPGTEAQAYFIPFTALTSISNSAIAYGFQIGSIYDYRSCLRDTALFDYANDPHNSAGTVSTEKDIGPLERLSLTQSLLNSTSVTNTTNVVRGMNRCMEDMISEATSDPTAATPITAANTAGSSVSALIVLIIAAAAKEYEHKIGLAIKSKLNAGNATHNIIVTLIVSTIIIISITVGVLPVIVTLVQSVRLAHRVRMGNYISLDEVILPDAIYISTPIKTSSVMQCYVTLPPPHYRVIVTVMGVILGLWILTGMCILGILFRNCCRYRSVHRPCYGSTIT